jgi:hypothetical protein
VPGDQDQDKYVNEKLERIHVTPTDLRRKANANLAKPFCGQAQRQIEVL